VAEAGELFDSEVVVDEGKEKLFAQGNEGLMLAQQAAQDVAEFQHHAAAYRGRCG